MLVDMTGQELKDWQSKWGVENERLARHLGVRVQEISRWRNDRVAIRPMVALALRTLEEELLAERSEASA
jgi:DNA-binding transcriptional regulator YiaG